MSDNKLDIPQPLLDGLDLVAKSANNDPLLLHKVCQNKNVTLEIVQLLLKVNLAAAVTPTTEFAWQFDDELKESTAYPLHLACCNEQCPSSVIKQLLEFYPDATKHFCALDKWDPHPEFEEHVIYGLPLNYYLSRTDNIDIGTVKMLVGAYPQAVIDTGDDDETASFLPIHTLLKNPNLSKMANIVQYLVGVSTSSIDQIAGYSQHPLHIACANKDIDAKIIQIILDAFDSAQVDLDHLPIHNLCANRDIDDVAALDILHLLLNRYPGWLREGTGLVGNAALPLHFAVGVGKKSPEFCKVLIDAYPESVEVRAAEEGMGGGILPICEACKGGRLETVKYLFDVHSDAMLARDNLGQYPIHHAAYNFGQFGLLGLKGYASDSRSCVPEIIEFILSKDPDGASRGDYNGRYPLHSACEKIDVVQVLYNAYPQAIAKTSDRGHTPHDIAREAHRRYTNPPHTRPRTTDVTKFLDAQLVYYQKAQNIEILSTYDENGRLPLHQALQDKAHLGSIKLLVNGNAAALQVADKGGMLLLHIACEYGTVNVVKYLAEPFDGHLNICDKKKNYPLHHACREGNLEVIKYLLSKQSSAAVSERNVDDKLPIHLLLECDNVDIDSLEYTETIWQLLLAYPAAVVV